MRFIDSHMHFWDLSRLAYTWLQEVPSIWHRHAPDNFRDEAGSELPEKIIFVEAGARWLEELAWVEELAASEPRIAGIVVKMVVDAGSQTTAAINTLKSHPLVRGVRHNLEHTPIDYCARSDFIFGVRQLAAAGLSFDICCKHLQIPAVIELVRACPQTSFILDHAGKPGIRDGRLDPWRDHIRQLALCSNVVCELSGLVTEADHENWTIDDLRPYISHLLETFGPGRLLFGGDWPVAKLATSYPRWLDTARRLLADLSPSEQRAIFYDNAARTYRL